MIERILIPLFPALPLVAAVVVFAARALAGRDLSRGAVAAALAAQWVAGAVLLARGWGDGEAVRVPLSAWPGTIEWVFDRARALYLVAYLAPAAFAFLRLRQLDTAPARRVFLFYLAGCSGLIVTGDVFNAYVFFELMLMAAYLLIALRGRFGASIKYMLVGSVSSLCFLAGIAALYSAGGSFRMPLDLAALAPAMRARVLLFFGAAFMIKAAVFPASAWAVSCHSATVSLVSAFLGSFTVWSGLFGFHHFVAGPALAAGDTAVLAWWRAGAVAGIVLAPVFALFEPDPKRCVAGSTTYSIGIAALLVSGGHLEAAGVYLALHALAKSVFFHALDHVRTGAALQVAGSRFGIAAAGAALLVVTGWAPGLSHGLKQPLAGDIPGLNFLLFISATLLAAAFLKFRVRAEGRGGAALTFMGAAGLALLIRWIPGHWGFHPGALLADAAALGLAVGIARAVRRRMAAAVTWTPPDRRLFPDLQAELFLLLVMIAVGAAVLGPSLRALPRG